LKLLFKIILLILIAFLIYLYLPLSSDKLIFIPKKSEKYFTDAFKLQKSHLNSYDAKILQFFDIKEGWIRVNSTTNKLRVLKKILSNKREKTRKMVMFSGDTIYNFTKSIQKQANLNQQELLNIYYKLSPFKEGGILAQKYDIPYKTSAYNTIAYMVFKSNSYFKHLCKNYNIPFPSKKFKEKLTIASLITKETSIYSEMPLISAVIYNRLKKHIPLQIDASLNYGKNSHTIVTSHLIKSDQSKYNTYKHIGLPPTPISSVNKVALLSAFMPAKVNYLYFVRKPTGGHIFSSVYKKHIKYVRNYKNNLKKLRNKKLYKLMKKVKIKFPLLRYNVKIPKIKPTLKSNKVKKLKIYF